MLLKIDYLKAVLLFSILFIGYGFSNTLNGQSIYLEWVNDPLESMVINWIDDSGSSAGVEYREEGGGNWLEETGEDRAIPGSGSQRVYSVKLNSLSPGQGYEFRVEGDNEIFKFRTPPDNLDNPIKFIVAGDLLDDPGDFEQSKIDFEKVSVHAAAADPYFAVIGGDLANAEGDMAKVHHWFDLFELWHKTMVTNDGYMIPIVAALGNNEVPNSFGDQPEDAIFFYTFFRYPQDQWGDGTGDPVGYGRLDFNQYLSILTLDSDHTYRIPGPQTDWLDNTLKNRQNFRHVIPVYHVTGWPANLTRDHRYGVERIVKDNWHPVFRKRKIRLVFEHHDHIYHRTHPIGDCEYPIEFAKDCDYGNEVGAGVIYMGGGAWGSMNERETEIEWFHDVVDTEQIHNFVVVEITRITRTATAVGEDGQVLDEFTDYIFLDPPDILPANEIKEDSFQARWEKVEGATNYLIDVSTDPDFSSIVNDNSNKSVGDTNSWKFTNLDPTKTYYYRVQAQNELTISDESEVTTVQLIRIDPDFSTLAVSGNNVPADKEQTGTVTATIYDEDNELVENFPVELFAVEGNLQAEDEVVRTDENGQAIFRVSNDRPEIVTYGAVAGSVELTGKVQVTFIPVAPVALSATDVQNRQFTANWEMVNNTDYYELDVATDEDFSNLLSGYSALDVSGVTSYTVNDVEPGTEYFYRVRAVTDNLIGVNSQTISTTTFPDSPEAVEPSDTTVVAFNANWNTAEGAENYRLDVATDSEFQSLVEGYEDLDVGDVLSYKVDNLLPGRNYFYRVRSEAGPRQSDYSNTINASTLEIDTQNSKIEPAQLRVLANGEQSNQIEITILAENGALQEGVNIQLQDENGSSEIEEIQPITNEQGVATFGVTNTVVEKVTYSVIAAGVNIGSVDLEFLEDEGVLRLGNNFPNPFRFDTSIPLAIPSNMKVKLEVFNSLGAPVRTLLDEELDTGYYEIPFNGADVAAGVYFYRLITDDGTKTGKMVLVK